MRSTFTLACVLCALVLVGAAARGSEDKDERKSDDSRIQRGFAISPVALTFQKKDRDVVGLGSYIVNAQAVCNDCHTCPSYAPGHNPHVTGLPDGGHTFEQFKTMIRTGHDVDDGHILQVMPWPVYRHMTDDDLRAIYEYLRAIPHADTPPANTCVAPGQ